MKVALSIGALLAALILLLGAQPAGAATRQGTDRDAGVRFTLENRALTVRLLRWAPGRVRRQVLGKRVRATCLRYVPVVKVTAIRSWPADRRSRRYRFRRNISRSVAWCLLERRNGDDIAFVNLRR